MIRIGVIGYGSRIGDLIKILLDYNKDVKIVAFTDGWPDTARSQMTHPSMNANDVRFYENADDMLNNEELDGCMIGTRCSSHTINAVKVLDRNIPLYLEKPVSTNIYDLRMLDKCAKETKAQTVVSFPLRMSKMIERTRQIIDSGEIGEVQHVQACNNVPYGGCYYHSWYRDENETGGLLLQKSTHDFDYINYILQKKPVEVCAMESKQIFKGNRPADLKCTDCPDMETCPESEFYMSTYKNDHSHGDLCCFSTATGNHDSASVIIRYEDGMHVNYSQNFFARKEAKLRGARFLGYKGTLEFDWYTGKIHVYKHDEDLHAIYEMDMSASSHFGGDHLLMMNFVEVIKGKAKSRSTLEEGINSALLCIKAAESARTRQFKTIEMYD